MVDSSSRMGLGDNAPQSFLHGFPFLLDWDGVGNNHMCFVSYDDGMTYRERQEFRIKSPRIALIRRDCRFFDRQGHDLSGYVAVAKRLEYFTPHAWLILGGMKVFDIPTTT